MNRVKKVKKGLKTVKKVKKITKKSIFFLKIVEKTFKSWYNNQDVSVDLLCIRGEKNENYGRSH